MELDQDKAIIPKTPAPPKKKPRKQKPFVPPKFEEFATYCVDNGFGHIAKRAFKGYDDANWFDSKGNPVYSWKQKLQNVWFTDNNKPKQGKSNDQTGGDPSNYEGIGETIHV